MQNLTFLGYTYVIGPSRVLLHFLGVWPDPYPAESPWMSHLRILTATSLMFVVVIVSQTVKIFLSWKDINLVITLLTNCNIPTGVAIIKIVNIWYHRYELGGLLRQIMQDWNTFREDCDLKIMWSIARISRIYSLVCIYLCLAVPVGQGAVSFYDLTVFALEHANSNVTTEWPTYIVGSFPYNVQVTPKYELSVFAQMICMLIASTSFASSDAFFVALVYHLIGQLLLLKMMIIGLPKKLKNTNTREAFLAIHKCHNQLWGFSGIIEDCFNAMFLMQLIPCIFALCTQTYQLIMASLKRLSLLFKTAGADNFSVLEMIFTLNFLALFLFSAFMYCYVADRLRIESMEISSAAYICDWTSLPANDAKLLVLIIIRSQNPFQLTAGKFAAFSLQLYCSILKTSAGYLSMLLAVKNK